MTDRERRDRYVERHPERAKASRKKWADENPDRVKAIAKCYREAHRERRNADMRARSIMRLYGLTVSDYEAIIARGCAICGTQKDIGLDHDHATGKVRDALCNAHNTGLARFQDDPEMMEKGARYLREHGRG